MRLAGLRVDSSVPSLAERIRRAAQRVAEQGAPVHTVVVSPRTYDALLEWQWMVAIEEQIDRVAATYQERTTLLSQMKAAARMANRRGHRFDARAWWAPREIT